jgi:hypothetical protein
MNTAPTSIAGINVIVVAGLLNAATNTGPLVIVAIERRRIP